MLLPRLPLLRGLTAVLLLCAPAVLLAAPPSRIEAHYEVSKGSFHVADMVEIFTLDKDRYTLESVSTAVGVLALFKPETIRVTSSGEVTSKGLRPASYSSARKLDSDRNTRAILDWAARQITLQDKAGRRSAPLPAGTQDRLSAMYQLMFLPLKDMKVLQFYMTNGSKVDDYTFQITTESQVSTPLGKFNAIHLATPPVQNENRTEIWVAEDKGYFPYKLVITEPDGGKFTQVLTRIEITP